MVQTRIAFSLAAALLLSPAIDAQEHTTGKFHGCPPEGKAHSSEGFFDPILNGLKNGDRAPAQVEDRKLADVIAKHPQSLQDMGKKLREKWSPQALEAARAFEEDGSRIEGRLIAIRTSGAEACNCGKENSLDMHVWIATKASSEAKANHSMVVELSPRLPDIQAFHDRLVQLAKHGTRIRVRGWMLWDEEHGSEVGKSRGTLWEIHPVHEIEVFTHGEWVALAE